MGILCDYFVAADDAAAAAAIDIVGGPGGKTPLPMPFAKLVEEYGHRGAMAFFKPKVRFSEHGFQVVATKNFTPFDDLAIAGAALTGESDDEVWPRGPKPVAQRDGGECVVLPINSAACAALIGATEPMLTEAAKAVARNAAPPGKEIGDTSAIVDLLVQLGELARGAAERGERMYCWVSL